MPDTEFQKRIKAYKPPPWEQPWPEPIPSVAIPSIAGRKEWWQEQFKANTAVSGNVTSIVYPSIVPKVTPTSEQRLQEYRKLSFWQQLIQAPAFMQGELAGLGGVVTELPEEQIVRQKQQNEQIVLTVAKAQWFMDFYTSIPMLVAGGKVSSYNDYMKALGVTTPEYISQQDIDEANDAIATLGIKKVEGTLPEFMQVEPGQEEAVRAFLEQPIPTAIPVSINQMTIDEIKKALTTPWTAKMPEGMTEEELFKVASLLDIPDDVVNAAMDMDQMVSMLAKAAQEQQAQIGEVLAGVREWEVPKTTTWQRLLFIAQQPMQAVADIMKPYLEDVSYPLAGGAIYLASKISPTGPFDVEKLYDQYRAAGINPWTSLGKAEQEWDAAWYWKLLIELPTDPLTYVPGIALSLPGKILLKTGSRFGIGAMKALGSTMIGVNEGLYQVLDFLPSAMKAVWSRFPKTFDQIIKARLDDFMQSQLYPSVSKITGKAIHELKPDDISKTMEEAVKAFRATPNAVGDPLVDFGRSLSDFVPLSKDKIIIWAGSRGGDKTIEFTTARIAEVNDIIRDTLRKVGSPTENAKRMAIALQINDTPEVIGRLIRDIATYSDRLSTNIARATQIGKSATVGGVSLMLDYLKTRQRDILKVTVKGQSADGHVMKGIVLGLQNGLDKVSNHSFRMGVDRFIVRPLAEAYLGNISYPFWNALEGMAISVIEGVTPGFPKIEAYNIMTKGLIGGPADVAAKIASEPGGILGKRVGITLLPGGKIGQWFGRKWIDLSNDWGNAIRRNFIMKRMSKYLVEKLYDVEGHDLNAVLNRITKGSPKIAKERLGLTQDELQRQAWQHLVAGDIDGLRAMKTKLTNLSLMGDEARQRLRKYTLMSPTARDMVDDVVDWSIVLKDNDSITNFVQKVADQSISDLRHYPIDVADSFRQLATDISGRELTTLDDLMDVFQTYEVMSTTFSNIPTKLMAETTRKADALYAARKFSQVEQLWRTDRQQMIDTMAQVSDNMGTVRTKIAENVGKLTPDQQAAMNVVLDRSSDGDALWEATFRADGQLLDDFWALPKMQRTEAEHTALRAYRTEAWLKYRQEAAEIGAGEMLSRKEFAKLYQKLPEPRLIPVDASNRALSADDVAKLFGCNIDALSSGIAENMAMQSKVRFVKYAMAKADSKPNLYRGFTEEKIESAYDDILRGMKMSPDMDVAQQKILMQMEGMKQELMTLRMTRSLKPNEEKALAGWIDNVADNAEKEMYTSITLAKVGMDDLVWADNILSRLEQTGYERGYLPQSELDRLTGILRDRVGITTEDILKLGKPTNVEESLRNIGLYRKRIKPLIKKLQQEKPQLKQEYKNLNQLRQESLDSALKDYYKTFADYSNPNIVDASMKMIYPYWTYTLYKWFELPRLAMKHPGLMAAWGKYYNYSDQGYQHIPGTDLEVNPFTGSMFGTTFGLARHDFVSYYSNLGPMGEVLDFSQRVGAFPGAHVMLPIVLSPILSGRSPELGGALPSLPKAGLGLLVSSNIPGVSSAAQWLQDKVFHDNLQQYYATTIVSTKQVESGGKLIGGQSGTDLWYKKLRKEAFTPEEQLLWDESYREAAWYGVVRSQFPQLRLRTEQYLEAYKQVTQIFKEQLGMSEEFQDNLWKHNKRPSDVVGGLPLDLRQTLDEVWQWRIYFGRGVTMMPPDVQDIYSLIDEYFNATKDAQQKRLTSEASIDTGFITPTAEVHYNGAEWRQEHAENWADYSKDVEDLKNSERFAPAIDALTPEGQVKLMKRLNFSVPTLGPMDEALDLYFNIKLEKDKDPYTGEEDYNYLKFWLQREAVKMALPEDLRSEFESYIRRYETPMEEVFRTAYNNYIRGYQAASRIIFAGYAEDQKALISEYYADTTTSSRKDEIEAMLDPTTGNQLISSYTRKLTQARGAMRQVSPKLDFWLNVFGYVDSQKTPEAKAMLDAFERDKTSITG